jgi:deazaflavin-dependent oxidoreductase (nitroreductase family)
MQGRPLPADRVTEQDCPYRAEPTAPIFIWRVQRDGGWARRRASISDMGVTRRNWVDRTRPLWRIGNRIEAFQLRRFGFSPMSLLNKGSVLLIETTGRRSGRPRFAPVGYWRDADGAFVVGGGAAGQTRTPDWVANLRAEPKAAVWLRRTRIPAVADELRGDERDSAQKTATENWPGVARYERLSGRVIPFFRLVPAKKSSPKPERERQVIWRRTR